MGGEVLELWPDRAERLEREAREEGRKLGLKQARAELVKSLRKLNVDEETIQKALNM